MLESCSWLAQIQQNNICWYVDMWLWKRPVPDAWIPGAGNVMCELEAAN